jgi:hypothetical protein
MANSVVKSWGDSPLKWPIDQAAHLDRKETAAREVNEVAKAAHDLKLVGDQAAVPNRTAVGDLVERKEIGVRKATDHVTDDQATVLRAENVRLKRMQCLRNPRRKNLCDILPWFDCPAAT